MRLKAVNNYVTIEPVEPKSASVITGATAKTVRWGRVTSVGPGICTVKGEPVPMDLKEGQLVYVMAHGKHEIDLSVFGSESEFICSILDVLCFVEDEETMKIRPLGNYVQVDKMEPITESAGGIILPEGRLAPPNIGTVKELGLGWITIEGNRVPFQVEVGDRIAFDPFKTMVVDLDHLGIEGQLHLVQHGNIMGVIED